MSELRAWKKAAKKWADEEIAYAKTKVGGELQTAGEGGDRPKPPPIPEPPIEP